jgi:uncharacterized membrane protein
LNQQQLLAHQKLIAQQSRTTHMRALAKAVTWRVFASLDTFALGWILTGSPMIGGSIAGLEVLTKMGLYYAHERAWSMVVWGVRQPPPDDAKAAPAKS